MITLHEVWSHNLEEEFGVIRELIDDYPFVAMDTEYPGWVDVPKGRFKSKQDFNYQHMRVNVNQLKLIQVGMTFVNERGELPPGNDVWQFNFHFDSSMDTMARDSGELLREAGIDFYRHQSDGIHHTHFGELLTTSGLLADDRVTWITFHGIFDFGYLMKSLLCEGLPDDQEDFLRFHRTFFPCSYDLKALVKQPRFINSVVLKGGLQDIADQLDVPRFGQMHQAGSDSLLTAMTYFKMRDHFCYEWNEAAEAVRGVMFSLGVDNLEYC